MDLMLPHTKSLSAGKHLCKSTKKQTNWTEIDFSPELTLMLSRHLSQG